MHENIKNRPELKRSKSASKSILTSYLDIKVPFYDVDPMRIVWHGNYVKYIEKARCHFLDQIDFDYVTMEDSGFAWPVVDMRLKYVAPARFSSNIRVYTFLIEYESRLKINYEIYDLENMNLLNKAHTIQVAVKLETEEMQFESPTILLQKLRGHIEDVK